MLVLVNDCVATSLRLFAELKPQFFVADEAAHSTTKQSSPAFLEAFLNSTRAHARKKEQRQNGPPSNSTNTMKNDVKNDENADFNATVALEMHRTLFVKDWKFYKASLLQFRKLLMASQTISSSEKKICYAALDRQLQEIHL